MHHGVTGVVVSPRYCTDDMLLREMMSDPFLEHYGVVVIDQAHHRTVSTDVLLGLLKDILKHRPELRVVLLTVDPMADRLLKHYGRVPFIRLESTSAAQVVHCSGGSGGSKDYFYAALRLVLEIHRTREEGDVAVFLASAEVGGAARELNTDEREVEGFTAVCLSACLQEVQCAQSILKKEGTRLGAELGQLVPVALCSAQGAASHWEQPATHCSRTVFLATRQAEDMCWPTNSVYFVIDTGVQKQKVDFHSLTSVKSSNCDLYKNPVSDDFYLKTYKLNTHHFIGLAKWR